MSCKGALQVGRRPPCGNGKGLGEVAAVVPLSQLRPFPLPPRSLLSPNSPSWAYD